VVVAGQQAQGDDDLPQPAERAEHDRPHVGQAGVSSAASPSAADGAQARVPAADSAVQAEDEASGDAGEDGPVDGDDAAAAAETPTRPGPAVPLRLLLLVTALNVLLAAGLLVLRPPWRVERGDAPPALPPQVAELQGRVARGEHQTPYTLTLTDDELTATARYFLAQSEDVPFGQVRVAVVDGRLEASGVTTGLAVAVPVRVVANVEARNGAPVISVVDVGIGGLALPTFVREQILTEANRAVDLSRYELAVTVDAVTLRPGALDVRGTVR
jgi:hypothetical protein